MQSYSIRNIHLGKNNNTREKKASLWEEELRQIPASSSHWARRYAWLSSHSLAYLNVVAKFIWGRFLSYSSHPITVKGWVMIAGSDPRWNRGSFHSAPACWYYRGKKKNGKKREMAQWQVALHVAPTCCALKKMDKLLQKAFISSTCKDSLVVKICV